MRKLTQITSDSDDEVIRFLIIALFCRLALNQKQFQALLTDFMESSLPPTTAEAQ